MIYIILILIAFGLIALDFLSNRKRKLRVARKSKFEFNSQIIDKIDNFLKNYELIYAIKEKYVEKLGVINTNKRRHNNGIAIIFMATSLLSTILLCLLLLTVMNMWYVVLVIGILNLYFMNYAFTFYLNSKLKKIYSQFPVALQLFTDIYITNKNIKSALNDSYKEMPYEVGIVFEKLARRLSSGHEYERYIKEFADSLSYVWGYAFSELLLMSYEGSGDISNDLLFLNELINDDIQDEEESKAEMATNKMLFLILNVLTLVTFVCNVLFNPVAKELYFYTSTGNTIIMVWVIVIALGISISSILDHI
jgi:Flp pilus assembly protein TadB